MVHVNSIVSNYACIDFKFICPGLPRVYCVYFCVSGKNQFSLVREGTVLAYPKPFGSGRDVEVHLILEWLRSDLSWLGTDGSGYVSRVGLNGADDRRYTSIVSIEIVDIVHSSNAFNALGEGSAHSRIHALGKVLDVIQCGIPAPVGFGDVSWIPALYRQLFILAWGSLFLRISLTSSRCTGARSVR